MPLHRYITPLIYPIFPERTGALVVGLDLQTVFDRSTPPKLDFECTIAVEHYASGELISDDVSELAVRKGVLSEPFFTRRFVGTDYGYVQISIRADRPVFSSLNLSVGYGLLMRPGFGTLNVLHDEKFASPGVIQQIREIGRFCLLHPACLWDPKRNAGNSFFFVNPYRKALTARLVSDVGRAAKQRVPALSAVNFPLEGLLEPGRHGTVMLTGTNRFPVWDLRHAIDDPTRIANIDHLEIFRGAFTHESMGIKRFVRGSLRRLLREMRIRIA